MKSVILVCIVLVLSGLFCGAVYACDHAPAVAPPSVVVPAPAPAPAPDPISTPVVSPVVAVVPIVAAVVPAPAVVAPATANTPTTACVLVTGRQHKLLNKIKQRRALRG